MFKVFERVATWNSKRYDRVFSSSLASALLREEYKEWLNADGEVHKLDALCDITYVALGVIWKLNVPLKQLDQDMAYANRVVLQLVNLGEPNPAYLISTHLDVFDYEHSYPALSSMCMIVAAATSQMLGMGLTIEQVVKAMNIVCDANDTKTEHRVAPNVKANVHKGVDFIPPEPRLTKLLAERYNG